MTRVVAVMGGEDSAPAFRAQDLAVGLGGSGWVDEPEDACLVSGEAVVVVGLEAGVLHISGDG